MSYKISYNIGQGKIRRLSPKTFKTKAEAKLALKYQQLAKHGKKGKAAKKIYGYYANPRILKLK